MSEYVQCNCQMVSIFIEFLCYFMGKSYFDDILSVIKNSMWKIWKKPGKNTVFSDTQGKPGKLLGILRKYFKFLENPEFC